MIKISELKERDVLVAGALEIKVIELLRNCVIVESNSISYIISEDTLNQRKFKLKQLVATPEKKYFMGFEVREYPERPIVEVSDNGCDKHFMRLIEVHTDHVTCIDSENFPSHWDYVYRIPETKIVEPTSSGTREGDGC